MTYNKEATENHQSKNQALILIRYHNDYFAEDGILREVDGESSKVTGILENTTAMLKEQGDMPVISAPGLFYGRSQ